MRFIRFQAAFLGLTVLNR